MVKLANTPIIRFKKDKKALGADHLIFEGGGGGGWKIQTVQ